ncbi:caspase family protein [Ensifer sp. HO-A22]|uniref:Caspase family protein n=1 Tax=Ensifer oleiphilus TaxID=2742698 RepID=A0A7Y6Q8X6_9HYPH|nr:caspase family protein [Ensifer oleiphilus]NVD41199.1 caspase family protein [Ensifer oleiphilus]
MSVDIRAWSLLLPLVGLGMGSPALAADRALLIGIGSYHNLPPKLFLHGPKNDLVAMEGLLAGILGFDRSAIRVLKDGQATRATILSSVEEWLIAGTEPGDRAYLYYSGHGLQVADIDGDEADGLDEALAPFDVVAGTKDWDGAVTDDDLDAILDRLKGRAVTLVIDACHSDTISRSLSGEVSAGIDGARFLARPEAKPVEQALTRGLRIDLGVVDKPGRAKESGIAAWSASAPYQVAWDDVRLPIERRHGVFTEAYVAGQVGASADANANGLTSNAELFEYVAAQSAAFCASQQKCETLDPQFETKAQNLGASAVVPVQAGTEAPARYQPVAADGAAPTSYQVANAVDAVGDIVGKADAGDVRISIDRPTTMKAGDVFKLTVASKVAGSLILLDVGANGAATQIFPNEFAQKITPLAANVPLTLPDEYYGFDFEASGEGESAFVALVVSDAVDLADVAPKTRGLKIELSARETLSEIVSRLQQAWTDDLDKRGIRWSVGTLRYHVE